jgi:uncharacterized GH25 family protein
LRFSSFGKSLRSQPHGADRRAGSGRFSKTYCLSQREQITPSVAHRSVSNPRSSPNLKVFLARHRDARGRQWTPLGSSAISAATYYVILGGVLQMNRIIPWGLLSLIILIGVGPSSSDAHDGWVEISPAIVEQNQAATIALIQGNHSNEHKSYRIAGKWDQKNTTLLVVDPKTQQTSLTDRMIDFGEDAEAIGPKGPKGFFLASFVPKEAGLYQAVARQARTLQQGDGPKIVTVRIAKAAFAALKVPTVSAAQNLKGFDRVVAGADAVEFIPLSNPLAIVSGGQVTLELRRQGKPATGQTITLVRRIDGPASVQERTTDEKGRVTFAVGPADSYLARVKIDEETSRPDGQKDKASYESTYVFQAFNRP